MSIRSLWVLSSSNIDFGKVLFFRTFTTVEKRHKKLFGSSASNIPAAEVFASALLVKLGLSSDSKQYVPSRDKASRIMQLPVIDICDGKDEIWPLVVIEQSPFIVCCLPLLEERDKINKEKLLKISSISVGFSVAIGVLNFLGKLSQNVEGSSFVELDNFLTLSMPFGTPSDMESSCIAFLRNPPYHNFLRKQPAWKPVDYKGKQHIDFILTEYVRGVQSDQLGLQPICEVYGQVSVKAELEGAVNDVSVSISNTESSQSLQLDSIVVHPSVQIHTGPTASAAGLFRRLRFSPPLHHFILFHYRSAAPKEIPIQGVFKMLGESFVELLLQLKLSEKMRNNFDFCDVSVNFFQRGPVKSFDYNSNHGQIKLSDDKHSMKWSLGTKFPRDLEVVLTAKLEFKDKPFPSYSDPFCSGKNCYAQINFRQTNTNLSGCSIDSKTVTVSPAYKPRINIDRSVQSSEYRVWNSYGELPFPVNINNKFVQLHS